MKKYHYFITYFYADPKIGYRCANAEIVRTKPLESWEGIVEIGEMLKKANGYEHEPTILNYTLLRVDEVPVDTLVEVNA